MSDSLQIFPSSEVLPDFQELYKKVSEQIKKDFHPYAEMNALPELLSSTWLFDELKKMLTEVVDRQNQSLGAILYRVDLSEKMVRFAMHQANQKDKLDELTAMVLKREAQKVWIRHNYKP